MSQAIHYVETVGDSAALGFWLSEQYRQQPDLYLVIATNCHITAINTHAAVSLLFGC